MDYFLKKKRKKSPDKATGGWWKDLLFATTVATFVHWIFLQPFAIPTGSMENSLLIGDHLFVSKFHYGARTPATPLQIPFTQQTIWGTNIPSYTDLIQLPTFRLPGITSIKNNDIVVFNWPDEQKHPIDQRTFYVKRCVAIAGDTLEIKNREVLVNQKKVWSPPEIQFTYLVTTNGKVSDRVFEKYHIAHKGEEKKELYRFSDSTSGYVIAMPPRLAQQLTEDGIALRTDVFDWTKENGRDKLFPQTKGSKEWNLDNYGPLWIPKEGASITLDSQTIATYASTIKAHEGWKSVENKGDHLVIDGNNVTEYTFQQNYYFMMGDNRHNSLDSRFWGFVPADHVVGKPILIWLSFDPEKGFFSKIRWSRLFRLID